ncbi:nose resistant to fluoxetine protein 6-like [Cylas formicarius]|uniref:nose resistant to fluoxetine protein 6-like n=1 Tax=Cylas formicarius TaxID=197179 RepID=UPI002958A714|nr:nose resistant to fluoxetine protein 6-like [Cylas formicarius]
MKSLWLMVFVVSDVSNLNYAFVQNDFDLFPELPLGVPNSDNPVCREQSELFVDSLKNYTLWAHEMWDATVKASTGVLRGNMFQMGHFEQCLTSNPPFEPQYCFATITIHIPKLENPDRDMLAIDFDPDDSVLDRLYRYSDRTKQPRDTVNLGWCIPASCSILDLEKSLTHYLSNLETPFKNKNITYTAQIKEQFCHRPRDKELYTPADITFGLVTLILLILVFIATAYDYRKAEPNGEEKPVKSSKSSKLILAFSARRNFLEMSHTENSNPALNILYGLRTFSIMVVILDHRFGTFTSSALINFDFVEHQYRAAYYAAMLFHGDLFVDSFFLLSGLLVAYGLLSQYNKRIINPGFIIFLRYIRLTPVYAFVIFYYATVFNYTGNGPLWKVVAGGDVDDCKNNWWTNLLYINNYVNPDHMCMTHAWYLPCDFHYFIIAIGLCLLIHKEKKLGLSALFVVTIVSMVIPFVLTVIYMRPSMLMFYPDFLVGPKSHPDFLLTYSKSHTRATPYFVGMFAGYMYHVLKGSNKHVCRIKSWIIITLSIALILAAIFSGVVFYNPYHPYNAIESGLYSAFHRPLWAVGSIGLMYVTSYGHASFFKKVLEWGPWIPLSKLQYGAYLIHMQFQLRSAAKFMNPKYISYFDLICVGMGDIVMAFAAALCLYLMIEAPFRIIFKELLMSKREPKPVEVLPTARENMIAARSNHNNNYEDSRL